MHDGAAGLSGSRVGFRGTEDLGGGLKANFNVETRILANDGALKTANMFGEGRSVVGLSGGFGSFDLGREYTPLFRLVNIQGDVDGASSFSTTGIGQGLPDGIGGTAYGVRANNSFNYVSPNMGGFVGRLQFANGSSTSVESEQGLGVSTVDTVKSKERTLGLSGAYAAGPLMVGMGYHRTTNRSTASLVDLLTPANSTYGVAGNKTTSWGLAGTYDFVAVKLFANYTQTKATQQVGTDVHKAKEYNVGVLVPFGATSLVAGLGRNRANFNDGEGFTAKGSGTDYVLGVNHDLSKRTRVYARLARINSLSGNAYFEGEETGGFKARTTRYSVGLAHTF